MDRDDQAERARRQILLTHFTGPSEAAQPPAYERVVRSLTDVELVEELTTIAARSAERDRGYIDAVHAEAEKRGVKS